MVPLWAAPVFTIFSHQPLTKKKHPFTEHINYKFKKEVTYQVTETHQKVSG